MICPYCGKENPENLQTCDFCGGPLEISAEEQITESQPVGPATDHFTESQPTEPIETQTFIPASSFTYSSQSTSI